MVACQWPCAGLGRTAWLGIHRAQHIPLPRALLLPTFPPCIIQPQTLGPPPAFQYGPPNTLASPGTWHMGAFHLSMLNGADWFRLPSLGPDRLVQAGRRSGSSNCHKPLGVFLPCHLTSFRPLFLYPILVTALRPREACTADRAHFLSCPPSSLHLSICPVQMAAAVPPTGRAHGPGMDPRVGDMEPGTPVQNLTMLPAS